MCAQLLGKQCPLALESATIKVEALSYVVMEGHRWPTGSTVLRTCQ